VACPACVSADRPESGLSLLWVRCSIRPRPGAAVVFNLGQHLGGVPVSAGRQPPELIQVALLAGRFDQLVHGVPAAGIREPAQFGQIPALGGAFHKLIDGVGITVLRALSEGLKFRVRCLHASTMGAASVHVQSERSQYRKMSIHSRLCAWMRTRNSTKSNSRWTLTM
jgi:hypothetical protein